MSKKQSVRYCGRDVAICGEIKVGNKVYSLLKKVGHGNHQRFWVHDPHAGPHGDFRQLLILPRGQTSKQHISVLNRLSRGNPNLPMIIDYRPRGDEVVLVTTWIRGKDLETHLRNVQKGDAPWLSPTEVMRLYRGLAHGLSQMHQYPNVVHGDIKPANLVLAGRANHLVMIDFGSAWAVETTTSRMPGDGKSDHYAAPEQLLDQPRADFRSDQFSATVVAYQMLTGDLPYAGAGGLAGKPENRSRYEPQYEPPSRRCPLRKKIPRRIWNAIDDVIGEALALDANRRFQTGGLWLDALEDLQCDIRQLHRRVRFSFWDSLVMRLFDRLSKRRTPPK